MALRAVAVGALALVGVAVALLVLGVGRDDYTLKARFYNAGQLVRGGDVQVAGRRVGTIDRIELSREGLAEVTLSISDDDIAPLHEGTRAQIRAIGAAGVANRFVNLLPGSQRAPELPEDATLDPQQTGGIVDLDALFNAFDPRMRDSVRRLTEHSAEVFAGSGGHTFNAMLAKLDPALGQVQRVFDEVGSDGAQLQRLIRSGDSAAGAIASRRLDLTSSIDSSARWLSALAGQRAALTSMLERAPGVLRQAGGTLARADTAVRELRPALRDIPPATPSLAGLLERTARTLPVARPVVADLRGQLPGVTRSLAGFRPLERPLRDALRSTGEAFRGSNHMLRGLRMYAPDFLLGIVNGLAGVATGNYNAAGHYTHAAFVEPPQTFLSSPFADLLTKQPLVPGLFDQRTKLTRRCPGALAPPAPDGSNRVFQDESLCDPSQSMPESVNRPAGSK